MYYAERSNMGENYCPNGDWQTVQPEAADMDAEKLGSLDAMIRARYDNINGVVVVRRGYIVFERYYNGFGPDDVHHVASVTKSFMSALTGIAIDAGYIGDTEQRVLDFFPEYAGGADDIRKRTVTIRQLLTMTAPFPFSWKEGDRRGHEPLDRLRRQQDWVKYILNLMGQGGQPGKFQYYTGGIHLLSAIITRTTGKCAREFANERLFRPIGIQELPDSDKRSFTLDDVLNSHSAGWFKDPDGNNTGGLGLKITPRDMARFGLLYLNRGAWNGERIISDAWIDASTKSSVTLDPGVNGYNGYGYLLWIREEAGIYAYLALGDGGNVICCIPEKDIVVAIASGIIFNPLDRWPLIEKCIIPAAK